MELSDAGEAGADQQDFHHPPSRRPLLRTPWTALHPRQRDHSQSGWRPTGRNCLRAKRDPQNGQHRPRTLTITSELSLRNW